MSYFYISACSLFTFVYDRMESLEDEIQFIVNKNIYGLGCRNGFYDKIKNETEYYWCAEENYSSELLREKISQGVLNFKGFSYNDSMDGSGERIDRGCFGHDYLYDIDKLKNNKYVDIHCMRPYNKYEPQLIKILNQAKMI